MDDGEQQQRQDELVSPQAADDAAIFAFSPDAGRLPLPRWLVVSLMWMAALALAAAAVGAGMRVMRERQTDVSLAMVAAHARVGTRPLPITPADAGLARGGVVNDAVESSAGGAESAVKRQPTASSMKTARPKKPSAKQKSAVSRARALKSPSGKAKAAVRKPASVKKASAAAKARKSQSYTWPRRSVSVAECLDSARRSCRARPHAPGQCNLRACDVLGSAHPACR